MIVALVYFLCATGGFLAESSTESGGTEALPIATHTMKIAVIFTLRLYLTVGTGKPRHAITTSITAHTVPLDRVASVLTSECLVTRQPIEPWVTEALSVCTDAMPRARVVAS
jgi:hypothetical protein